MSTKSGVWLRCLIRDRSDQLQDRYQVGGRLGLDQRAGFNDLDDDDDTPIEDDLRA